jgi:hypothetical protein
VLPVLCASHPAQLLWCTAQLLKGAGCRLRARQTRRHAPHTPRHTPCHRQVVQEMLFNNDDPSNENV